MTGYPARKQPPDLTAQKDSAEYKRLKALLSDREWRLDNLYWIRDEAGRPIKFVRNDAQRAYSKASWCRDVIAKSRKLGFSTYIAVLITDECVFRSGTIAGIVDRSLDDACDKLEMVRFAFNHLPEDIQKARPLVTDNQKELTWENGSTVTVGTSYRGGTPSMLHWSEAGYKSVEDPEGAREIMTGAIQAVPASGRVWVESTAHGTSGVFYDIVSRAKKAEAEQRGLTRLDFKMNFFGWWMKREYRLPNNLVVVPLELREYFQRLKAQYGISIDADQQAWYTKKYEELGPDDCRQEFPSTSDELFYSSIEGAFFKNEISKARADGRIGQLVPFDPTRRVNTAWDIGEDMTAIWFHQTDGIRHRMIDYYEEEGGSLQAAAAVLDLKAKERRFIYDKHYGPHDLDNRDWGNNAQSRYKTAVDLGIKFTVVPRTPVKADSIESARRFITMAWFDSEHTAIGVERLENYRKRWNKSLGVFTSEPVHDLASHGSDAVQQIAMGLSPEKPKQERPQRAQERKVTAWAS